MSKLIAWVRSVGAWWIVVVFVMCFILTFLPRCSRAADFEVQAGSKVVRGPTWAAAALVYFPHVVADKADVRCRILLYGPSTYQQTVSVSRIVNGKPAGTVQEKVGTHQDQNAQVGCQVLTGWRRLDLGLGVQGIMRGDAYNACCAAFWLTLRYRAAEHFSVEYSHSSNAGTKTPNLGSDFVLAAWKF